MNKKGQFGLLGRYDTNELPKWVFYTIFILFALLILFVIAILAIVVVSYIRGDVASIPISIFGRSFGSGIAIASPIRTTECYKNGILIDCDEIEDIGLNELDEKQFKFWRREE